MSHHYPVIRWRLRALRKSLTSITDQILADSLSVEGLPHQDIPPVWLKRVVAFRHLHRNERVRRCRSLLLSLKA